MVKQFRHRVSEWLAWIWQELRITREQEIARMKWYKTLPQPKDEPCMQPPPSFDYVPRFKSGSLARAFSRHQLTVGKEIARTGFHHLTDENGTHVDTDKLFKPVDWWGQQ